MKAAKMKKVLCLEQLANVSKTGASASPDVKYVGATNVPCIAFFQGNLCVLRICLYFCQSLNTCQVSNFKRFYTSSRL